MLVQVLEGQVARLARHKVANAVLELCYNDFSNGVQRNHFIQEFFGSGKYNNINCNQFPFKLQISLVSSDGLFAQMLVWISENFMIKVKVNLKLKFFSTEFQHFKDDAAKNVLDVLKAHPEKLKSIIINLQENSNILITKGCYNISLVHSVLYNYMLALNFNSGKLILGKLLFLKAQKRTFLKQSFFTDTVSI